MSNSFWMEDLSFTSYHGQVGCQVLTLFKYMLIMCLKNCQAIIVFDGYENGPSTKDIADMRRLGNVIGNKYCSPTGYDSIN